MEVIPLRKKVLVKLDEQTEKKTAGGIILQAGAAGDDKLYGTIMAVGPEAFKGSGMVKKGDRVLMLKYHGDPIDVNGDKCKIMDDETILGVIKE